MKAWFFASLILLTTVLARPAVAQDEEARALFVEADKKFQAGDLEGALDGYRKAYELVPRAKILLNITAVLAELGRDAEIANTSQRYLDHPERDETRTAELEEILADLDLKLGKLTVTVGAGGQATLDDKALGVGPLSLLIRVEPGTHRLVATFPNGQAQKDVDATPGSAVAVELAEPAALESPPIAAPNLTASSVASGAPPFYTRPWSWTLGATGFSTVLAVFYGLQAKEDEEDYAALIMTETPSYTDAKRIEDRGRRNALISNIGWVSAGAFAIASGYLLYQDRERFRKGSSDGVRVTPALSGDAAMLFLEGSSW